MTTQNIFRAVKNPKHTLQAFIMYYQKFIKVSNCQVAL